MTTLLIEGISYDVRKYAHEDAYCLSKAFSEISYNVTKETCDCAAFTWKGNVPGKGENPCKHIKALRKWLKDGAPPSSTSSGRPGTAKK